MTTLDTLRAVRDAAREAHWNAVGQRGQTTLDALLALQSQVTTLENAEKLETECHLPDPTRGPEYREGHGRGVIDAAAFLRATVEGA